MHETLTTSQIADALLADDNAAWTYAGARALAEYLEEYEDQTGEPLEFDRVAIRCEYSEYGSALEAAEEYGYIDEAEEEDEIEEEATEWLQEVTTVIPFATTYLHRAADTGVIIQDF